MKEKVNEIMKNKACGNKFNFERKWEYSSDQRVSDWLRKNSNFPLADGQGSLLCIYVFESANFGELWSWEVVTGRDTPLIYEIDEFSGRLDQVAEIERD